MTTRAFDSVESAHEYVGLLLEAIEESAAEVGEDLRRPGGGDGEKRHEAFRLVAYKLEQLRFHIAQSRCRLDDLLTLRRIVEAGTPTPQEG
jgi:hypothetical protein